MDTATVARSLYPATENTRTSLIYGEDLMLKYLCGALARELAISAICGKILVAGGPSRIRSWVLRVVQMVLPLKRNCTAEMPES